MLYLTQSLQLCTGTLSLRMGHYTSTPLRWPTLADTCAWRQIRQGRNVRGWISKYTVGAAVEMCLQSTQMLFSTQGTHSFSGSSSFSPPFHRRWPCQCDRYSQRSDHFVLRGLRHTQTHRQLVEKRSSHQYWPESEYVQVDSGFLSLCFLVQE